MTMSHTHVTLSKLADIAVIESSRNPFGSVNIMLPNGDTIRLTSEMIHNVNGAFVIKLPPSKTLKSAPAKKAAPAAKAPANKAPARKAVKQ